MDSKAPTGIDIKLPSGTYFASKLGFDKLGSVNGAIQLMPEEKLELVYVSEDRVTDSKGVIVYLTDVRMGKIEQGKKWQTFLPDVQKVSLLKGGMLRWDKIALEKEDGSRDTYGIYNREHALPFLKRLEIKLEQTTG